MGKRGAFPPLHPPCPPIYRPRTTVFRTGTPPSRSALKRIDRLGFNKDAEARLSSRREKSRFLPLGATADVSRRRPGSVGSKFPGPGLHREQRPEATHKMATKAQPALRPPGLTAKKRSRKDFRQISTKYREMPKPDRGCSGKA